MAIGTIIAANYVGMARVLADSVQQQHRSVEFFTLIIDGSESDRSLQGLGQVLLPEDLDLPRHQWQRMAAIYSVTELATALKPSFLRHLLGRARTATYLDPDVLVLQPLDGCFQAAEEHAIALTPHCLHPLPRDGKEPSERTVMLAGIYNLGFICVGQRARPFLRWWHERLVHDAVVDVEAGLFTDQRWVDWVPSLFEHTILRDPGLNVAYWNIHERELGRSPDGTLIAGGVPLRFFHFSGFVPGVLSELSRHTPSTPRVLLDTQPVLEELCARYASELEAHGHTLFVGEPYRLDHLPHGAALPAYIRKLLRAFFLSGVVGSQELNPFEDRAGYAAWLTERVHGDHDVHIARWERALWSSRPDLQTAFADLDGPDAPSFRHWLDVDVSALKERALLLPEQPPISMRRSPGPQSTMGWTVIAYADAELGVGEAGRRLSMAARQIGLPVELVCVKAELSRREYAQPVPQMAVPSFANSISCVNADQLARVWRQVGVDPADRRGSRVGLFFWEVDRFPEQWLPAISMVDQVWVASEHTQQALAAYDICPVELVSLPVVPRSTPTPWTRRQLGLPEERSVFLVMFDFLSVLRRKNPIDAITAYTSAFGPNDGTTLVLKSINGHQRSRELASVQQAVSGRPDIIVSDGYRSAGEVAGLIERSDCLVSLHRAEGYGLNMIDAMAVGTPVIATGYSGNLAFMSAETARLVPYEQVPVGPGAEPYPAMATWAQPDLEAAAQALREVVDHPMRVRDRAQRARVTVLRDHSLEVAGARVRELSLALMGAGMSA